MRVGLLLLLTPPESQQSVAHYLFGVRAVPIRLVSSLQRRAIAHPINGCNETGAWSETIGPQRPARTPHSVWSGRSPGIRQSWSNLRRSGTKRGSERQGAVSSAPAWEPAQSTRCAQRLGRAHGLRWHFTFERDTHGPGAHVRHASSVTVSLTIHHTQRDGWSRLAWATGMLRWVGPVRAASERPASGQFGPKLGSDYAPRSSRPVGPEYQVRLRSVSAMVTVGHIATDHAATRVIWLCRRCHDWVCIPLLRDMQ